MTHPCEVCKLPERTDTVEVALIMGGSVWVCGSCGYGLLKDGELAADDEEDWEAVE